MRHRRGATIVEMMTGLSILTMTFFAVVAMYVMGLKSFHGNSIRVDLSQKNAQGIRHVSKAIRQAATVSVSLDGKTLIYTLPRKRATAEPLTGELEYEEPITSDGLIRTFRVVNGQLLDQTGRVYVKKIAELDPEPGSSQYGKEYQPFTSTTIGSQRAVTINIITSENSGGRNHYMRSKSTVMLRNAK
jgi:hypothetical protein